MALNTMSRVRRPNLRQILCLIPLLLVVGWLAVNWRLVAAGTRDLTQADRHWLLLAFALTALSFVVSSCVRQGSIIERLPPGRLLASQFAAGAANHLLPAGIGAHMVTLRFLQGCGIPLTRATASLALYSLVEPLAKVLLLLTLLVAFPSALRLNELLADGPVLLLGLLIVLALLTGVLALLLSAIPQLRGILREFLRTASTDARVLHAMPARALALWGGALAFPLVQAASLTAVALAVGVPVPWLTIGIAYLAASVIAGGIPTPGGIGSVDAALVILLVAAGSPVAVATTALLGYRIVTAWLPLLPGALVLGALVRRGVL